LNASTGPFAPCDSIKLDTLSDTFKRAQKNDNTANLSESHGQ
jgi:hypothetical protein